MPNGRIRINGKDTFFAVSRGKPRMGTRGGEESIEPSLDVAIAVAVATASDIAAKTV